jgi:hypothetical protein
MGSGYRAISKDNYAYRWLQKRCPGCCTLSVFVSGAFDHK